MRKTREEIIRALKRAAEQEQTESLGRTRFTTVTGIREHEWKYYWPRWNDVVDAAGLTPATKTTRRADEDIFAQLVLFIRQLGRWPSDPELRIHSRAHVEFPSATTIYNQGGKLATVQRMKAWCGGKDELSDIALICEELLPTDSDEEPTGLSAIQGYVYLMKTGKYYKIGKSKSPDRRRSEVALLLPDDVETVHVIPTDDPDGIERYWHARFEGKRHRGEFFLLDRSDVQAFKRRKDYM